MLSIRAKAIANTGRYAGAHHGALMLARQPLPSGWTACAVAGTPATDHAHLRPSSNSVMVNGSATPTGVRTRPVAPSVSTPPSTSPPETVGPHFGHASVSTSTFHTASAGASMCLLTESMAVAYPLRGRALLVVVRPEDELVECPQCGVGTDLVEGGADFVQVRDGHLQRWLIRLVGGADRIVDTRLPGHLDMTPDHMRHRMRLTEVDQSVDAVR